MKKCICHGFNHVTQAIMWKSRISFWLFLDVMQDCIFGQKPCMQLYGGSGVFCVHFGPLLAWTRTLLGQKTGNVDRIRCVCVYVRESAVKWLLAQWTLMGFCLSHWMTPVLKCRLSFSTSLKFPPQFLSLLYVSDLWTSFSVQRRLRSGS